MVCPHCVLLVILGFLSGLPVIGVLFWRARVWMNKRRSGPENGGSLSP